MANNLISIQKIRQILLFLERGVFKRTIEKEVDISKETIALYFSRFHQAGVCFSELLKQSDQQLENFLTMIKTTVPPDTNPRKVHFNSLVGNFW